MLPPDSKKKPLTGRPSSIPPPPGETIAPPTPSAPSSSKSWAPLVGAAAAVGVSIGVVYGSLFAPMEPEFDAEISSPRRAAHPEAPVQRRTYPLRRVSATHYTVEAKAIFFHPGVSEPHTASLGVFLDTGTSLPLATADAAERLNLQFEHDPAVYSRGFAGSKAALFAVNPDHNFEFALERPESPDAVLNAIQLVAPDSLAGSDVVMSPKDLAPAGGAVNIDLGGSEFSVCENLDACLQGDGWEKVARPTCRDMPELLGVSAVINGRPTELLLDTGGSTLVFDEFSQAAGLTQNAKVTKRAELIGSGDARAKAELLAGRFDYELGGASPVTRTAQRLWNVTPTAERGAVACYPAGSVGLDLLAGCELVIADQPSAAFLRCE